MPPSRRREPPERTDAQRARARCASPHPIAWRPSNGLRRASRLAAFHPEPERVDYYDEEDTSSVSVTLQRSPLYRALKVSRLRGISPLTVALACLLVPARMLAAELLVPEAYATIQAALDVAVAGDVVSVAPGLYPENVRFGSDGVTLRSRVRHGATIQGSGHVVDFSPYGGTVEGFVITGAVDPKAGVFTSGAAQVIRDNWITGNGDDGIHLSNGSVATIDRNIIIDNAPTGYHSGIRINTGASATIVNNYIEGSGVGIWDFTYTGGADIFNNTLVDNANFGMLFTSGALRKIRNNLITGSEIGIHVTGPYDPDLSGSIGQFLEIDYNLLWNNSMFDYFAYLDTCGDRSCEVNEGPFDPLPGTSEVQADPLLDPATGYELSMGSPAIDAGDDGICPATDLDGQSRPVDGNDPPDGFADCDIGAFEYLPEPSHETMLIAGVAFLALLCRRRTRALQLC